MSTPVLSRQQRRQQQRAQRGRSKPASNHSRRVIDPIHGAQFMAGPMPAGEQLKQMAWTEEAIAALRAGTGSYADWCWMQSTNNIMRAVNGHTGMRCMDDTIASVQAALVAIFERATNGASPLVVDTPEHWTPVTLYQPELESLYQLETLQLAAFEILSNTEWNRARAKAKARAQTQRAFTDTRGGV